MNLPYSCERICREETRKGGASKGLDSYRLGAWWVGEGVSALGWWSVSYRKVRTPMEDGKNLLCEFMLVYKQVLVRGFTGHPCWSSLLSIWQILSLSGSKATCQLKSSRGWECVCPKGYEGDGRICYGNAADVSNVVTSPGLRTCCTGLTLDLTQRQ